jgi:ABC-2 type transport system ATP-binding protein
MDVTLARGSELRPALEVLARYSDGEPRVEPERRFISLAITNGAHRLPAIVRDLDAARVTLDDLNLRKPTLDDVFLTLTGHVAESASTDSEEDDSRKQSSSDKTSQEVSV